MTELPEYNLDQIYYNNYILYDRYYKQKVIVNIILYNDLSYNMNLIKFLF